jgi:phosphohistidine phosphatase
MRVYLVRHGIAEMRSIASVLDEDRALAPEGKDMMRRVSLGLAGAGYVPEGILSSPLLRARQTAEILGEHFGEGVPVDTLRDLAPGGDAEALFRQMMSLIRKSRSWMLVGHQPSLGETAGRLIFGSREYSLDLKEGDVCVIEVADYQGQIRGGLHALLPAEIWRNMGT